MKDLGQHFLIDELVLDFEAEKANVKGKIVLEIGAGDGRLTSKLLEFGAKKIIAVEIDKNLAQKLLKKFKKNVEVYQCDFLNFDEKTKVDVIVGNIPYYITSQIIIKLSNFEFENAILCLQKEVAERMVAKPGSRIYSRLSVFCSLLYKVEILAEVPPEAFYPPPSVYSAIVSIKKTGFFLGKEEEEIIGAIFSHKKKNLKNAIIDARESLFRIKNKKIVKDIIKDIDKKYLNSEKKVFMLKPEEILQIAKEIKKKREKYGISNI
jgi:16S rRNA (adenine1518-N6/adenine1519-N6)-dimethyltransferase